MRVDSDRVRLDSSPINDSVIPAAAVANAGEFNKAKAFVPTYGHSLKSSAFVSGQRPR